VQWHVGIDAFIPADESAMGIGKVFTETSHLALYGQLSTSSCLLQCHFAILLCPSVDAFSTDEADCLPRLCLHVKLTSCSDQ